MTPLILEGQQIGDYLLAGASKSMTSSTRTLEPQTARMPLTEELVDELIRNERTRITENLNNPRGSSPDAITPRLTASSLAQGLLPNDDEAEFGHLAVPGTSTSNPSSEIFEVDRFAF